MAPQTPHAAASPPRRVGERAIDMAPQSPLRSEAPRVSRGAPRSPFLRKTSSLAGYRLPTGAYPERHQPREGWFERLSARVSGPLQRAASARRHRWASLVEAVAEHGRGLDRLSDDELRAAASRLQPDLARDGFDDALVARVFALVREAAGRTIGQRHYDVQLIGGWVLLRGMVAEMETGEGKTIAATLAASAAALAGLPVHIITVNDYLAARDAEWMGPVYRALGLSVGLIVHGLEPDARRRAYACDVTYGTNKEITFDYLRDRLALGHRPSRLQLQLERLGGEGSRMRRLLLRGLVFGIVDEADSVLVDEARTPLIISAGATGEAPERQLYETAIALARQLVRDRDFTLVGRDRSVELTERGMDRLAELAARHGPLWAGRQRREELARQALVALHLMARDTHYLVREGRVEIVDEFTGRVFADRSWEHGLHQLVEAKEGCEPTVRREPLARISYQRFFRRYLRLSGMTGTGKEVARELWAVYRLAVVRIPTNRPINRRAQPDRIHAAADAKWAAVVARVGEIHGTGRPVLIGTRSVAASEHLSRLLTAAGLTHQVLNARQDRDEAEVIARAGERGRITVATNMAGRGTDIRLGPGVAELGGLHVIATERHEARRIDRQLFGRCGRQGDPGAHQAMVSLEDEIVTTHARRLWRLIGRLAAWAARPLAAAVVRHAQRAAERRHSRARRDLLRLDEQLETTLAFSGRGE